MYLHVRVQCDLHGFSVVFALPAVHLKIEEIGRMLRTGDLGIPPNPADRYNQQSVVFVDVQYICCEVY